VEAAVLLPALLIVLTMLVQPACYLYTRCVMQEAASEALRVAATDSSDDELEALVLRRLEAVPDFAIFHDGDWEVSVERADGSATVTVSGRVKALPFFAPAVAVFTGDASGSAPVTVTETAATAPGWLSDSYSTWVKIWG
jgi:Flp pilus assembly protein TadG